MGEIDVIVGLDDGSSVIVGEDEIAGRILNRLGVKRQSRFTRRGVEYRALVPGNLRRDGRSQEVTAFEPYPVEISGLEVSGKIARKIKAGIKKIAKNKVVKGVVNAALSAAEQVPVYGQGVKLARGAVKSTSKAVKAAKKAGAKAVKLGPAASKKVAKAAGLTRADAGGTVVTTRSGRRYRVVAL